MSYEDYCYCDDNGPSVFSKAEHVARKWHRCSECHRGIAPGEKYEKHWGIWDGEANTFKHCPRCLALIQHIEAHVKCICWSYGAALSEAHEVAREYESESPELLAEVRALIDACRAAPMVPSQGNIER